MTADARDHERFRAILAGERLPALLVDLDAFDRNLDAMLAALDAGGATLRLATKSVRVRALIERVLARGGARARGLLCYSSEEAAFLAERGHDDLLVAYPIFREAEFDAMARLAERGVRVALALDAPEAVARAGRAALARGTTLAVVACVDMSLRALGGRVHVGVRRSPLHEPREVLDFARLVADTAGTRFAGLLAYEAQIAGLGDDVPGEAAGSFVKRALKRVSSRELAARRVAMVDALERAGLAPGLVNGGGTGSLDSTTRATGVTEVSAGSGLFKPHLFDRYAAPRVRALEPACFFALEVTRRPGPGFVTCLGGGYVASGPAGDDKLPLPWSPRGVSLLPLEMAGEVQTPLELDRGVALELGAPVVFRHAKAGEIAERFSEALLVSRDRVVARVPTYRGEGRCFF